ncbi:protein DpdG [Pseudomonas sp. NPDC088885]|uniref:protein DpdG n=1 Tax=Pseudomonas sp. NPDC088885 TaxID=3364457 RepID=UPI0038156CE7
MSILNRENDGLHPILLTLARIVARDKAISRDDLINVCVPHSGIDKESGKETDNDKRKDLASRARATLLRWVALGLFAEDRDQVRLDIEFTRGESVDAFTERLPTICRGLALRLEYGMPLWPANGSISEEEVGRTADLCRGLAWCLTQDIYALPSTHGEIESLITTQVQTGRFIFLNDTRWTGLRSWARFLGFATGDDSSFFFDPTVAVRSELKEVIRIGETVPAAEFVSRLAVRLPVLDSGVYRLEVEQVLRPESWIAPATGHLSTALSFALRRLQKQGMIGLVTLADAGSRLTLVGQGGRTWESFTHISLLRDAS